MAQRPWRYLTLGVVGAAVLVANYDPVVSQLPGVPQGGGLAVSETAKQAFVLAAALIAGAVLGSIWLIARSNAVPPSDVVRVLIPAAIGAVAVFLALYAGQSDDRAWLVVGTLVVLALAAIACFDVVPTMPALPAISLSRLPVVTTIAAAVLIVGYWSILQVMFSKANTDSSTEWERLVALFAGVQSIGFAAVGALLGQQVQKTQTAAETARADENKEIAASAKALAGEVDATLAPAEESDAGSGEAARLARTRSLTAKIARLRDPR
jgi:hypothetical protein